MPSTSASVIPEGSPARWSRAGPPARRLRREVDIDLQQPGRRAWMSRASRWLSIARLARVGDRVLPAAASPPVGRERDQSVGPVAAPHLSGVGVLGRGARAGEVHPVGSAPRRSRRLRLHSTGSGASPKRWVSRQDLLLPDEVGVLGSGGGRQQRHGHRHGDAIVPDGEDLTSCPVSGNKVLNAASLRKSSTSRTSRSVSDSGA